MVLFFDEFDVIHDDNATEACSSMLSVIRAIRNDLTRGIENKTHVIHPIVSIGTYAILMLNQTHPTLSPFNISDNFQNRSLSMGKVFELYYEFAKDRSLTIDDRVMEDIFLKTNG